MVQAKARVIYNKNVKRRYFEIALDAAAIARSALPGQFVNIKVSDGLDPFLRRPLSIHRAGRALCAMRPGSENYSAIVLLYEIVGKGTEVLSERKSGEYLDIIGPLGNGFAIGSGLTTQDAQPILVAGGMGTAPLVFLAEKLREVKSQKSKVKTLVLIGAKTKEDLLCENEFRKLGCEVKISTDDGSRGFKGYVSELLKQRLSAIDHRPPGHGAASDSRSRRPPGHGAASDSRSRRPPGHGAASDSRSHSPHLATIYACGPKLLLKEISRISEEYNIPAQLSLESHMACGIGACMGCVIKTQNDNAKLKTEKEFEYKRVCNKGPVFAAQDIIW